eukprot:TRINITY_DN19249_c0_g1_i1.p1 TRINITY_DN19249_c0_g1~~TRINITY_DN19249_c0_g1_i1.p1  ORF type:complete len:1108 (+),score=321.90 TRINITY_DN19249_c0_g1_i1:144-3467(+)
MEWEVILDDLVRSGTDRSDRDGQLKALNTLEGIVDELPNTTSPVPRAFYTGSVLSGLAGLFGEELGEVAAGIIIKIPQVDQHLEVVVDVILVGWGDGDGSTPVFHVTKGGAAARRTRITHCTFRVFNGLFPEDCERIFKALTLIVPKLHKHEKMHVWEEAIKFVTHGLMVAAGKDNPLSILKLQPFFELIVPRLADPRPRVQFALIECLAVLNKIYSERTIIPLLADLPRDGRKDLHEMILERFQDSNLPIAGEGGVLIQPVLGMVSAEERINLWLPDPEGGQALVAPPSAGCSSLWSGGGRSTPGHYTRSAGGQTTSSSLSGRVGVAQRTPSGAGSPHAAGMREDEYMELQSIGSLASRGSPMSKSTPGQGDAKRRWDVQPLSREAVSSQSTVEPTLSSAGSLMDTFSSGSDALSLLRIKGRRARSSFHDPSTPSVMSVASSSTVGHHQVHPLPTISPSHRSSPGLPPPAPSVNHTTFAYSTLPDRGADPLSGSQTRGPVGSNVVRLMRRGSGDREQAIPYDAGGAPQQSSRPTTSAQRRVKPQIPSTPEGPHAPTPTLLPQPVAASPPPAAKPVKGVVFNLNLSFKPAPASGPATGSSQHPTSVYRGSQSITRGAPGPGDGGGEAPQDAAGGAAHAVAGGSDRALPRFESRTATSTGGGFSVGYHCQNNGAPGGAQGGGIYSGTGSSSGSGRHNSVHDPSNAVEQANFDFTSLEASRESENPRTQSLRLKRGLGRGLASSNGPSHRPPVAPRGPTAPQDVAHPGATVALKGVDLGVGVGRDNDSQSRDGEPASAGRASKPLVPPSDGADPSGSRKWKGVAEQSASPLDEIDSEDLVPLDTPEHAFGEALAALKANDDWKKTFESLNVVRAVAVHHSKVLTPHMQSATQILIACTDNLRSAISKTAIMAFCDVIESVRRGCDKYLDTIVAQLVRKAADSNHFLVDQAERALNLALTHCGPNRALNAILNAAGHKAVKQRAKATKFLHIACAKMKESVYASKDIARLLQLLNKTISEGNFEIRHWGRQCLAVMYTNELAAGDFERFCGAKAAKLCPKQVAKVMDVTLKASQSYRVDQTSDESSSFGGTFDGTDIGVLGASIGAERAA